MTENGHDAGSARREALRLSELKEKVEAEMDDILESLTSNDGPGLDGNLVDANGFPRADIDVHLVRQQRNRFSHLKTDHKNLSGQLEKLLRIALAPTEESSETNGSQMEINGLATPGPATPAQNPVPNASGSNDPPVSSESDGQSNQPTPPTDLRLPFATVDQISPSSPASQAGLQINDKLVAIGAVSLRSSPTPTHAMSLLPGLVQEHQNIAIDIVVQRQNSSDQTETVNLSLTPHRWGGQGLLGFHITPLQVSQIDPTYNPEVATATMNRNLSST